MSAPGPYDRQYSFTQFSTDNPNTQQPGVWMDAEYNAIAAAINDGQTWLAMIQRSDGMLANLSVGLDQLKPEVVTGLNPPIPWTGPGTYFPRLASVIYSNSWYWCLTSHTSSAVFNTDYNLGYWQFLFNVNSGAIDIQQQISNYAAQGVTAPFQRWAGSGDGATVAFAITGAVLLQSSNYLVSVGGILQDPNNYTITANTITFSTAVGASVPYWIVCIGYPKAAGSFPVDGTQLTAATVPLTALVTQATGTIIGNNSGITASPTALTATQVTAMLNVVTGDSGSGGVKGLVPAPTAGQASAGAFLLASGVFAVPATFGGDAGGGGTVGYVPAPQAGDATAKKYLSAAGVWVSIPVMTGDAGSGGVAGYVPAPAAGDFAAGKYLAANGAWSVPPNSSLPGFRNRIFNGDFRIDSKKSGSAYTVNSATAAGVLDGWLAVGVAAAGVYTLQQLSSTPPGGAVNYVRVTVTTADASPASGSFYTLSQTLTGYQIVDFQFGGSSASSVTLSFQVKSTLTGTFSGALTNAAGNRSYPFTYTIGSASTWTSVAVVIPGDQTGTWVKDSNSALVVKIDLGSGATKRGTGGSWAASNYYGATSATSVIATNAATFEITQVQLEKASTASVFEARPITFDSENVTTKVYAEYNNNATQVLTANVTDIIFTTLVRDTHSAYNVSTGVFTAPRAGEYRFDAGIDANTNQANTLQLYKGGVATYPLAINGGASLATVAGSRSLFLAAGDTVTVRSVVGSTLIASAVFNFITISSVG